MAKHRPRPGIRPDPLEIYWPPDDGYPRLPTMRLEILWGISQGIRYRDLYKLVGCRATYPRTVVERSRKHPPLELLQQLSQSGWPLEPQAS